MSRASTPQGTSQPGGVIVYQMTIRHAIINGLRVLGGVRVQLDLPKRTGYVQLISLLNEVFLTHYVTTMSFLPPSSAAGVAWSAIPWNCCPNPDSCCRDPCSTNSNQCNCKPSVNTKVETAQVIFCDPNHAQRFKTVLDTINSAFCCEDNYMAPLDPCMPYQQTSGLVLPQTLRQSTLHLLNCQKPCPYGKSVPNPYDLGAKSPACGTNAGSDPIPLNNSGCPTVCCPIGGNPGASGAGDPYSRPCSSMGQPYPITPPAGDPDDPYAFPAGTSVAGQLSAQVQGADPYAFTADRILFCAPACLVRLERRKTWREIFRGNLKIVQRATGANFSLILESKEGNICSHHFITSNMDFEPSCMTQFGYTFQAFSRSLRGGLPCSGHTVLDDYLISFQGRPHFDQFGQVAGEVQKCLEIINPSDSRNIGVSDCC